MSLAPLAFGLAAVGLYRLIAPADATARSAALRGPQPLQAGVPYLFIVRLRPLEGEAAERERARVRAFLATKAATLVTFAPATNPPPGAAPSAAWGREIVSFKVTPSGSSTIELGKPFYDFGTLEAVSRLDGRPWGSDSRSAP